MKHLIIIIILILLLMSTNVLAGNITKITWHTMTDEELENMRIAYGTYEEDKNYNIIVDGHGTGLAPPTEAGWKDIKENWHIVDKVELTDKSYAKADIDHTQSQYFPPIGNQGSEGSCTCFANGYYVKTFLEAIDQNWDFSSATWEGDWPGYPNAAY